MGRSWRLLSLVVILALGLVAINGSAGVSRAQSATPAANEMQEPEGVTFEPIGFAAGVDLPTPADMVAVRFTIDPGAKLPLDPGDPTGGLLVVQSGTFTIVAQTALTISRGAMVQQAMATPEGGEMPGMMEAIAVGQETTLGAGDVAYVPGAISGEIRNDGQEPAVGLVVLVGPAGMLGEGTPEAGTPTS
jgi:hypothetical protein